MKLHWSELAVAVATAFSAVDAASYTVDPDYSIGARIPISDGRSIDNFQIFGTPQLLRDRIILTPEVPGNKRVGIWGKRVNPHDRWTLTTEFRAAGAGRAGGSLHLWYTSQGPRGGSSSGTDTIYTSKPWDGLALVIDSHTGAGQVRGYLNDGQKDYSQHHSPASLAFAHCDFDYRNKGSLSQIKLSQDAESLKVEVDGRLCFQTKAARLPRGYFFGITAATSEIPDSYELFKFILDAPPRSEGSRDPAGQQQQRGQGQQGQGQGQQGQGQQGQGQNQQKQKPDRPDPVQQKIVWKTEPGEEDREASFYKSQEEQFSDLHSRLQALTHHLASLQTHLGMIYDRVDSLHHKDDEWRQEARNSRVSREQIDRIESRLQSVEKLSMQIAGAMTSKDYTANFEELRNTLKEHHMNLLYAVPDTVGQALATGGPKVGMMVTIVVLVQVGLAGAYVIYKKRRNSSPKKYL